MKQFISFVQKEARHILRDRRTMLILFGMPVVLMLLFGFAITTDVRNVRTVVVTSQLSPQNQQAIERLAASEYFTIVATVPTPKDAELLIRHQKADLAIVLHLNAQESSSLLTGQTLTCRSNGRTMHNKQSLTIHYQLSILNSSTTRRCARHTTSCQPSWVCC